MLDIAKYVQLDIKADFVSQEAPCLGPRRWKDASGRLQQWLREDCSYYYVIPNLIDEQCTGNHHVRLREPGWLLQASRRRPL